MHKLHLFLHWELKNRHNCMRLQLTLRCPLCMLALSHISRKFCTEALSIIMYIATFFLNPASIRSLKMSTSVKTSITTAIICKHIHSKCIDVRQFNLGNIKIILFYFSVYILLYRSCSNYGSIVSMEYVLFIKTTTWWCRHKTTPTHPMSVVLHPLRPTSHYKWSLWQMYLDKGISLIISECVR